MKDSLWVKVMKGKYFPKTNLHNSPQPKPYHSCIWKNIFKQSKFLNEATFWSLGNGKSINVWKDKWTDNFKIEEFINQIPPHLSSFKVAAPINWFKKSWSLDIIKLPSGHLITVVVPSVDQDLNPPITSFYSARASRLYAIGYQLLNMMTCKILLFYCIITTNSLKLKIAYPQYTGLCGKPGMI